MSQSWLFDCSFLIALAYDEHLFYGRAMSWLDVHRGDEFYFCSIAEGALLRVLTSLKNEGRAFSISAAWAMLRKFHSDPRFHFLGNGDFSYLEIDDTVLRGTKQITDAWLAQLARRAKVRLLTFDDGLAGTHEDVAVLA